MAILRKYRDLLGFNMYIGTSWYCTEDKGEYDALEEHTTEEQWKVIDQIIAMVTRVVLGVPLLNKMFFPFELNNTQTFLTHVVPSY